MAWPTTKAGTTNVDAGSDSPTNARADIKQNIDNVNSIIDEFNISSPSDGDLLQYSSSSGQWEQVASSSVGSATSMALISALTGDENVSGGIYRTELEESFDPNGIISLNGSYQFTLTAGTYFIDMKPFLDEEQEANYSIYNETDSTNEYNFIYDEVGTTGDNIFSGQIVLTPDSTKNYSFRQDVSGFKSKNSRPVWRIYK